MCGEKEVKQREETTMLTLKKEVEDEK